MLILTAKYGHVFRIEPGEIDPATPIGDIFAGGPIEILVAVARRGQVKLGIEVDTRFLEVRLHRGD